MARIGDGGDLLKCSFCGKSQKQVKKLIAGPVDTFMKQLKVGQAAWRIGWSVTNNPAFYQAGNEDEDMRTDLSEERPDLSAPITIENAETRLFYRVERQTFVRLPK